MKNWYIGYVRGGWEFDVAEALTWDNFDVWVGRVKVRKRVSRKRGREITEEPALPNYIFLRLSDAEFYAVHEGPLYLEGKHDNLRRYFHKTMFRVPTAANGQIEAFQRRIGRMEVIDNLQPGAALRIIDGPFKDERATLAKLVGKERLSLDMSGIKVEVPLDFVEPYTG